MSKTIKTVQGTKNLQIKVYTNTDLSALQNAYLEVHKPSGGTAQWPLTLQPSDEANYAHMLVYTTAAGDLDEAGNYVLEAWIDLGAFVGPADEPIVLVARELGVT